MNAFRNIDGKKLKRVKEADFIRGCEDCGFNYGGHIWHGVLSLEGGVKVLTEHDFEFLDRWKPPRSSAAGFFQSFS